LLQPFELPNLLTVREQWNAALKYLDGENIATLILWPESFEKKP
jgi:hypothetical protein